MKRTATLILLILLPLMFTVSGCKENVGDDFEKDYPATAHQIQGSWSCPKNGCYIEITFSFDSYVLTVTNVFGEDPFYSENGTFTMDTNKITLITEDGAPSEYSPLEAYWVNTDRSQLILSPLGRFYPVTD